MTSNHFQTLVAKNQTFLNTLAYRMTKDQVTAQDLYQDTMFLVFKHREKFQIGTNFRGWVRTIMKNAYLKKYINHRDIPTEINEAFTATHSINLKTENPAESNLMMEVLTGIIRDLDDKFQLPFELFYEGFAYEEISQKLDLPIGTVKSRIFAARQKIKESYQKVA